MKNARALTFKLVRRHGGKFRKINNTYTDKCFIAVRFFLVQKKNDYHFTTK